MLFVFTSKTQLISHRAIRASQLQSKRRPGWWLSWRQELYLIIYYWWIHQSWSHSDLMVCSAVLVWHPWLYLRREISHSNPAQHLELAGKFHTALNSSDNWRIQVLFSAISPVWGFCLMLSNYLLFCLWSSHRLWQLHLHINELSHSSCNDCAEVPVLSPPCSQFLSINLSCLCKERLPRARGVGVVQQQQTCKQTL